MSLNLSASAYRHFSTIFCCPYIQGNQLTINQKSIKTLKHIKCQWENRTSYFNISKLYQTWCMWSGIPIVVGYISFYLAFLLSVLFQLMMTVTFKRDWFSHLQQPHLHILPLHTCAWLFTMMESWNIIFL